MKYHNRNAKKNGKILRRIHSVHSLLFLFLFLQSITSLSQTKNKFFSTPDTLNQKRFILVSSGQAAIWISGMIGLNQEWYAQYPKSGFHFYNDMREWQQVDKVGHGWSAYFGSQLSTALFQWSGVKPKRAALYGTGVGIGFVTLIEILDAYSAEWGFSVGDISANISGSLLFGSQQWLWGEQRIQYKFSSHISNYPNSSEQRRANHLFGKSLPEKILKDYNHQTYWLSVNLSSFFKKTKFPKWLNVAVGYGASGMLGGYENKGLDKTTLEPFNFSDVKRIRQFYFSPDIDLSRIEWHGKKISWLKPFHFLKLKFPMPAIEWNTGGQLLFHPIYF